MRYEASTQRVRVAAAAGWTAVCLLVFARRAPALSAAQTALLWTAFQPLPPLLLMLLLVAKAMSDMQRGNMHFADCFPADQRRCLPSSSDLAVVAWAFTAAAATALACCGALLLRSDSTAALLLPPLLYVGALAVLLLPLNVARRPARRLLVRTLGRVLVPVQPVSWADFLVADVATSLAFSSSSLARAACLMLHGQLAHPSHPRSAAAAAACGALQPWSLGALVLPYALRMLQCISVWRSGGPASQLANALKYASSLPALMLTQMEHEHHVHHLAFPLRPLWLAVMVANSAYSFLFDVEFDWDMPFVLRKGGRRAAGGWLPLPRLPHQAGGSSKHAHHQQQQRHRRWWVVWLLASNLALRFSWAHRLLGDLEAHNSVLMAVALLEVLRRWQWLYVRVEVELQRIGALSLLPTDSETEGGGGGDASASAAGPAAALLPHGE